MRPMVTDLLLVGDDEGVLLQHGALRAFYTSEIFFPAKWVGARSGQKLRWDIDYHAGWLHVYST